MSNIKNYTREQFNNYLNDNESRFDYLEDKLKSKYAKRKSKRRHGDKKERYPITYTCPDLDDDHDDDPNGYYLEYEYEMYLDKLDDEYAKEHGLS